MSSYRQNRLKGSCHKCDSASLSIQRSSNDAALEPKHADGIQARSNDSLHDSDNPREKTTSPFTAAAYGHDFGKVRMMADDGHSASAANDQSPVQSGGLDPKFMQGGAMEPGSDGEPKQDINLGADETKSPGLPVVDSVELVTSSSGAVGGYDAIECDASLNNPGPYNDQWFKGSVANVHQVQFHLSQGNPGDLRPTRMVNRTSMGRGQTQSKVGNDNPPDDHEYKYTKDKMVIADAPGWCRTLKEDDFPVNYKADFSLYAWDAPTKTILASISYHVEIEKTHYSQPDPVNTVTVTGKKIGGAVKSPVPPKK